MFPHRHSIYGCRDLRRIRHTLDLKTASVIATSLVHSKLDYCNLSILNLLAPLVLPIILLYSAHPPPLLLKYLIVHTTEPLLASGIIYQNLCELSLTRHLMLQPLVNLPLYHSHFLRLNFAHISKHTFSASRSHLNILSCSD